MIKDMVIAGDYKGGRVELPLGWMGDNPPAYIISKKYGQINLDKKTVDKVSVIDEETISGFKSGVIRATAGAAILGPAGMAAGLTASNKKSYTLNVEFKDGKKCMIEVNGKIYKRILECMY